MTHRAWRILVASFVFAALAAASSMIYANAVARESEHRWCGIVTTLDDTYQDTPPQSPTGKQIADELDKLRIEFDCPPDR
ncbi:hypothetical protein ABTX15_31540 [Micromonospora sp. NPDC094482]|uniref:hypothetical protein n=1 Tax=unclassified Micromonospora TaxID=2617518 RepID=UPI0033279243